MKIPKCGEEVLGRRIARREKLNEKSSNSVFLKSFLLIRIFVSVISSMLQFSDCKQGMAACGFSEYKPPATPNDRSMM